MTSDTTPHLEAASTLAVVVSSNEPLLFLTGFAHPQEARRLRALASRALAPGSDP